MSAGRTILATALLVATVSACGSPAPREPTADPAEMPIARQVPPDPVIGAVFIGGGSLHTCSAGVLDSPGGDLIMTAAHCLAGGIDATFVAGFNDNSAPADTWHVDAVYLDPRWIDSQDPRADFAVARVSGDTHDSMQAHVGRGLAVGKALKPGAIVTVTGYVMGVGGGPVSCLATLAEETQGFPSLPCRGLVDGLSGAPWVDGSTITGLVGGLHGGGCDESISYSPPFDDAVARLLVRAEAGGPADDPPTVFDSDCD